MVNAAYIEYIKSDEWDVVRRDALRRAGYSCQKCGISDVPLQVHHKHYRNFRNEKPGDLEALCEECHEIADIERRAEVYERQVAGFGRKVYGDGWEAWPGYDTVVEHFEDWLDSR